MLVFYFALSLFIFESNLQPVTIPLRFEYSINNGINLQVPKCLKLCKCCSRNFSTCTFNLITLELAIHTKYEILMEEGVGGMLLLNVKIRKS